MADSPDFSIVHPAYDAMLIRWRQQWAFWQSGVKVLLPDYVLEKSSYIVENPAYAQAQASPEASSGNSPDAPARTSQWDSVDFYPKSFLHINETETTKEFDKRNRQLFHIPLFGPIINDLASGILRVPPQRGQADQKAPPYWVRFWQDVDQLGTDIDPFMRQWTHYALVFGRAHAYSDRPKMPDGVNVATEQDRQTAEGKNNIRAYSRILTPFDITNWSLDSRGNPRWIYILEPMPDERSPGDENQPQRVQYRVATRDGWELYRQKDDPRNDAKGTQEWDLVDQGSHNLGKVAIDTIWASRVGARRDWACESPIAFAADADRALLNDGSELIFAKRRQAFSQMFIPTKPGKPSAPLDVGPGQWIGYDPTNGGRPSFETPDSDPLKMRWTQHKETRQEVKKAAGVGRGIGDESKERRSADAIVEEMSAQLSQMAEWSAAVQEGDRGLHKTTAQLDAQPESSIPLASYSKTFYRTAIAAATNVVLQLKATGGIGPVTLKMMIEPVISRYFGEFGLDANDVADAMEEIKLISEDPTLYKDWFNNYKLTSGEVVDADVVT